MTVQSVRNWWSYSKDLRWWAPWRGRAAWFRPAARTGGVAVFGVNAAWWAAIAILAHNLNAVMKLLVLGPRWLNRRMKALRFHLIALPSRMTQHARRKIIPLLATGDTMALVLSA